MPRPPAALVLVLTGSLATPVAAQVRDVGDRLEPFVDRYLIAELRGGARHRLHHPIQRQTVLQFDRPWEGAFAGYVTVLRDGAAFKMYYRGLPRAGADGSQLESTCLATSADGIAWQKPELGLFEFAGDKRNNIVLRGHAPASHNFSPFLDTRPDCPPEARFKSLGGSSKGLVAFRSADGIRWTPIRDAPVLTKGAFDSQNVSFWSTTENAYVCYFRTWDGYRSVSRATSADFVTWTEPAKMTYGGTRREHLYTNQTHPYVRAPHIYLGIAARFMPKRRVLTKAQAEAIAVHPRYAGDCSDAVLLTSRGGTVYDRTFMAAYVRPGPGDENWVSRTNYPALGVLQTNPTELSFYVQKNYGQPTARLDRYTLRVDGFASIHGPYGGGEVVTHPLKFHAPDPVDRPIQLHLNFATSAAGGVRVEIQDADGAAIPGFALGDAVELIGDRTAGIVRWRRGADLRALADRPIRLRFVLHDADVYALQFR